LINQTRIHQPGVVFVRSGFSGFVSQLATDVVVTHPEHHRYSMSEAETNETIEQLKLELLAERLITHQQGSRQRYPG